MAPFGDVLSALEDARQRAWSERSPKLCSGMKRGHRGNSSQTGTLPNSHSQPIYVPGKYSVSVIYYFHYHQLFWHFHLPLITKYSHRVVCRTRRRTKFMVSAMDVLLHGSDVTHYNQCSSKAKCHSNNNSNHYQIIQQMYLLRSSKGEIFF